MTALTESVGGTYDNVAAHFDGMADKYDGGCNKAAWRGPEVLSHIFCAVAPIGLLNLRVLDIGTGTGKLAAIFKSADVCDGTKVTITGTDIAARMLDKAITKGVIDDGKVSCATDLSWAENASFDAVTSCGVLDFVDDAEGFAKESLRVVKKGGVVAFTYEPAGTPNAGHKSIQHNPKALAEYFTSRGAIVVLNRQVDGIYNNFARSRAPVTNNVLVVMKVK